MTENRFSWKSLLAIQGIVAIYTIAGVMGKLASRYEFLSFHFFLFYGAEIAVLGIYALLWQQVIKRFDLSVAYANRAMALMWSLAWAALFFGESITIPNIVGGAIIIAGIMIVNTDRHE